MSNSEEQRADPSAGKSGASPSAPGLGVKTPNVNAEAARRSGKEEVAPVSPGETEPVRNTPPPDLPFGGD